MIGLEDCVDTKFDKIWGRKLWKKIKNRLLRKIMKWGYGESGNTTRERKVIQLEESEWKVSLA